PPRPRPRSSQRSYRRPLRRLQRVRTGWAGAVVLVFLAGVTLGWILPGGRTARPGRCVGAGVAVRCHLGLDPARGEDGSASPAPTQPTSVTSVRANSPPARGIHTRTTVSKGWVETAKLAE